MSRFVQAREVLLNTPVRCISQLLTLLTPDPQGRGRTVPYPIIHSIAQGFVASGGLSALLFADESPARTYTGQRRSETEALFHLVHELLDASHRAPGK